MYTRSYYDNEGVAHTLSGNYDGTALREEPPELPRPSPTRDEGASLKAETKRSPADIDPEPEQVAEECNARQDKPSGFFGYIQRAFDGILPKKFLPDKFGLEELLIIGLAAYLFFTKSGDKEFAIMLLLLIFVVN